MSILLAVAMGSKNIFLGQENSETRKMRVLWRNNRAYFTVKKKEKQITNSSILSTTKWKKSSHPQHLTTINGRKMTIKFVSLRSMISVKVQVKSSLVAILISFHNSRENLVSSSFFYSLPMFASCHRTFIILTIIVVKKHQQLKFRIFHEKFTI